jgi:hypothetical protein
MAQPGGFRPIFRVPSSRAQALSPMPQIQTPRTPHRICHSPPPFMRQSDPGTAGLEDILQFTQQHRIPRGNIFLLARGISLLAITHLRDLCRDYSLPTGGNKHVLVNRLVIYLETFGPHQQNLMAQFSAKLKNFLSSESEEAPAPPPSHDDLPIQEFMPEVSQRLFSVSPSCLFRLPPTECPIPFGPLVIEVPLAIGDQHQFLLTGGPVEAVPVLQFIPVFPDVVLRKLSIELNGVFLTFRVNQLWMDLS